MAYCKEDELRLGNIPLPTDGKAKRAVDQAADEIDAALGFMYKVPIRATGPKQRAVNNLLSNINIWLATGRLILELTASSQQTELHAYGQGMVNQALTVLRQILNSEIVLEGAELQGGGSSTGFTGPIIINEDAESNVTAFYKELTTPLAETSGYPNHYLAHYYVGGG